MVSKSLTKYEQAGKKYVPGGPNAVLTKKTESGFWVGIDEKFLVRELGLLSLKNLILLKFCKHSCL